MLVASCSMNEKIELIHRQDSKIGHCATASESSPTQCLRFFRGTGRALGDRRRSSNGTRMLSNYNTRALKDAFRSGGILPPRGLTNRESGFAFSNVPPRTKQPGELCGEIPVAWASARAIRNHPSPTRKQGIFHSNSVAWASARAFQNHPSPTRKQGIFRRHPPGEPGGPKQHGIDKEKVEGRQHEEISSIVFLFYSPLSQNYSLAASARPRILHVERRENFRSSNEMSHSMKNDVPLLRSLKRSSLFAKFTTGNQNARKNVSSQISFFASRYDKLWLETPRPSCSDLHTTINAKEYL